MLGVLTLPMLAVFGLIVGLMGIKLSQLALLLPGLLALPVFALIPCLGGKAVPLSEPIEEAKAAGRGLHMIASTVASLALGGLAVWAWSSGWFGWLLLGETLVVGTLYWILRASVESTRWSPLE